MSDRTLRPLALGDIFDEGFDLYKRNFALFLLVTAAWIVPLYIGRVLLTVALGHPLFEADLTTGVSDSDDVVMRLAQGGGYYLILGTLAFSGLWIALCHTASNCYLNRPASLAQAYGAVLHRLFPLLLCAAVTGVALVAGGLLCGFGILWPLTTLSFAGHTFLVEHKSAFGSLKRSNALVSGEAGRVLGALFLLFGFGVLVTAGFGALINYLLSLLFHVVPGAADLSSVTVLANGPGKQERIVDDLARGITQLVVIPFTVSVLTVLYFDLRVRKEAFDIELAAEDLGYPPLDLSRAASGGYMPPVMPLPASGYAMPGASGWSPPQAGWNQNAPPPGWAPPNAPGWRPPPGWTPPPSQPGWEQQPQAPAGWEQQPQAPPPGWGQPAGPQPGAPLSGTPSWTPPPPAGPGWGQQQGGGAVPGWESQPQTPGTTAPGWGSQPPAGPGQPGGTPQPSLGGTPPPAQPGQPETGGTTSESGGAG